MFCHGPLTNLGLCQKFCGEGFPLSLQLWKLRSRNTLPFMFCWPVDIFWMLIDEDLSLTVDRW